MGLAYSYKVAKKKIDALDVHERRRLTAICQDIRCAQEALALKAAPLLAHCMANCHGLCCRNIEVADIVTEWDLVYILAMTPQIETAMAACLVRERYYPSDCIFLENGIGPCLFPDHLRPERCVISFCRVEPSVEEEIGRVMRGFSRLIRFFLWRRLRRGLRHLTAIPCI